MTTIETDAEVATRLEFEQTQRSEGWKLLRGMLREQRRNLLLGAVIGISWAGFKTAVPQMTKNAINQGIEQDGPLVKWVVIIAGLGVLTGLLSGMRRYVAFRESRWAETLLRILAAFIVSPKMSSASLRSLSNCTCSAPKPLITRTPETLSSTTLANCACSACTAMDAG